MILEIPVLVKIISVFVLILLLTRIRVPLSLSLIAGSAALGLWMGSDLFDLLTSALRSLVRFQTLSLMMIVACILVMSQLMEQSGQMERILESFGKISRDDRTSGSAMAALIGLLPMPGGALFSAPMVEAALCKHPTSPEAKTLINYWFRHVWEYWWPLYPGVVLAVALLEVKTWQYMAIMAPMTAVSLLFGILCILRPLGDMSAGEKDPFTWAVIRRFAWEIMPILVAVSLILLLAAAGYLFSSMGREFRLPAGISILPGLVAGIVWVCVANRVSLGRLASTAVTRNMVVMLGLVASIMVFKGVLSDTQAVSAIRDELIAYRIPPIWIILAMPFLSGLITGISIGFVGASFPLIIPLFPPPSDPGYLIYGGLAYTFGYLGMMLSPVHLCFLVSKDYFRANLFHSYRYLVLPVLGVMLTAMALFFIWQSF